MRRRVHSAYHHPTDFAGLHILATSITSMMATARPMSQTQSLCHSNTDPHNKNAACRVRINPAKSIESFADKFRRCSPAKLMPASRECLVFLLFVSPADAFIVQTADRYQERCRANLFCIVTSKPDTAGRPSCCLAQMTPDPNLGYLNIHANHSFTRNSRGCCDAEIEKSCAF